jgi:DNA-binding NarL/FixJ family response regulator
MNVNKNEKIGIAANCFLVSSALELILAELELSHVVVDDPSNVPPNVSVVLFSFTTVDVLSDHIAAFKSHHDSLRIILFPQSEALLEAAQSISHPVSAVVPPTQAAAPTKSMISLVVEGHRILPSQSPGVERVSDAAILHRLQPGLLTNRQAEILGEVAKGQSNKGIANTFSISINTVETHVSKIIERLQVDNRMQAALALVEGMPLPDPSVGKRDGMSEL